MTLSSSSSPPPFGNTELNMERKNTTTSRKRLDEIFEAAEIASPKRLDEVFEESNYTDNGTSNNSYTNDLIGINAEFTKDNVVRTPKRSGIIGWDDYFLGIAVLSSMRSKDKNRAEGACIVDEKNRIISIGYSGFPRGCPDTVFPWNDCNTSSSNNIYSDDDEGNNGNNDNELHSKSYYLCDAVINAVLNKGRQQDLTGCRLYVTKFPTSDCVKVMIQSDIREMIVLKNEMYDCYDCSKNNDMHDSDDDCDKVASKYMIDHSNIDVRYYRPKEPSITLDFVSNMSSDKSNIKNSRTDSSSSLPSPKTISMTLEERRVAMILKEETGYDALEVQDNGRKKDSLSWNDYFMSLAVLAGERSKDPSTQVGACIVDEDRRIVGLGYNGMPRGCNDDKMPWAKTNKKPVHNKYLYVTHAEVNAILNSNTPIGRRGTTLYVGLFPCNNCAKVIIQAGIKKIYYLSDKDNDKDYCRASRAMLRSANVTTQQYIPTMNKIAIRW